MDPSVNQVPLQKSTFDSQGQEVVSPLISDRMITSNADQLLENPFFCGLLWSRWWPQRRPDDGIETEMWKHSDSEVDLSRAPEEESDGPGIPSSG